MTAQELTGRDRPVTDEEVSAFRRDGWVLLRGLIPPDVARGLLERAEEWMGEDGTAHVKREGVDFSFGADRVFYSPSTTDDRFRHVAVSAGLGRSTSRLLGRESPVSLQIDLLRIKSPAGSGTEPTAFHQDSTYTPADRSMITFWLALDEVTPEQGTLQFYSGSHRLGKLGTVASEADRAAWPELAACERTAPPHLQPGDATVHIDTCVHGATENRGDRPRWSYLVSTWPSDALYTGQPSPITDGLGLEVYRPMSHAKFPVLWLP